MAQPAVDGALVGGASLEPGSFAAICRAAAAVSGDGLPLVTLVILDGWGIAPPGPGNAVELARTPVFDELVARYPTTSSRRRARRSGCPTGQMGNSEVGHLTIGSGRILFQDLVRVSRAVEDGSLFENDVLVGAFRRARERDGDVHLLGLVSTGGVHSHIDHLRALLELARAAGLEDRRGSTRSPTAATSRRTRRSTTSRRFPPSGSRRWSGATTRWTATSAGSAPTARSTRSSAGSARRPTTRSPRSARATSAA